MQGGGRCAARGCSMSTKTSSRRRQDRDIAEERSLRDAFGSAAAERASSTLDPFGRGSTALRRAPPRARLAATLRRPEPPLGRKPRSRFVPCPRGLVKDLGGCWGNFQLVAQMLAL
jgi:hypothetical protein